LTCGTKVLLSVSRRTDIPAYFGRWFASRLDLGWVDVRNPYNQTIKRISLLPEDVLGYVFWSKNPAPFMDVLNRVLSFHLPVLYHVTVTGLPREIEPHIPDEDHVIRSIHELAARMSPGSITWRFDPTLPENGKRGERDLRDRFLRLSEKIGSSAGRVALSLVDPYRKIRKRMEGLTGWNREWSLGGARQFYDCNESDTCASGKAYWFTEPDLTSRMSPACIDRDLLAGQGIARTLLTQAATRKGCSCVKAVDLGTYDTCHGGCVYCYAVRSHHKLRPFPPF